MNIKPKYYLITWNGYLKYVKTTGAWCEIIQQDRHGNLKCWDICAPYPNTGEEEIKEISAQEYNKVKKEI